MRLAAAAAIALLCAGGAAAVAAGDAGDAPKAGAGSARAGAKAAAVGASAPIDRPAAIVGAAVIWQSEVEEMLARRSFERPEALRVLEELIETELVMQTASVMGIDAPASDVDAALAEIKKQNSLDDAALDAVLAQQGFTRARYREEIARKLVRLRFVNGVLRARVVVSDDDVAKEVARLGAGAGVDKDVVKRDLTQQRLEKARVEWLAEQKRRVHIERRL